jgi:hypothetical protein
MHFVETVVDGVVDGRCNPPDTIGVDRARIPQISNFSSCQIRHAAWPTALHSRQQNTLKPEPIPDFPPFSRHYERRELNRLQVIDSAHCCGCNGAMQQGTIR